MLIVDDSQNLTFELLAQCSCGSFQLSEPIWKQNTQNLLNSANKKENCTSTFVCFLPLQDTGQKIMYLIEKLKFIIML